MHDVSDAFKAETCSCKKKKKETMTLLLPRVSYFAPFVVKEKDPWNEIVTEIKRFKRCPGS